MYRFDLREQQILFGFSSLVNSRRNYCYQSSPLIAEVFGLMDDNVDVLKMGKNKYQGCDKYMFHLELEFAIPEIHLFLVGLRQGILGHPKYLYDTLLNLNGNALKRRHFDEGYDPYGLIRRVFLEVYTGPACDTVHRSVKHMLNRVRNAEEHKRQENLWKSKETLLNLHLRRSVISDEIK